MELEDETATNAHREFVPYRYALSWAIVGLLCVTVAMALLFVPVNTMMAYPQIAVDRTCSDRSVDALCEYLWGQVYVRAIYIILIDTVIVLIQLGRTGLLRKIRSVVWTFVNFKEW
jgi:hypothetical protein